MINIFLLLKAFLKKDIIILKALNSTITNKPDFVLLVGYETYYDSVYNTKRRIQAEKGIFDTWFQAFRWLYKNRVEYLKLI